MPRMNPRLLLLVLCLAGNVLLVGACSPNKILAAKLKEADRAVVMSSFETNRLTLTGADLQKIIQAIAIGKKAASGLGSAYAFELHFFKGNELVEKVTGSEKVFWTAKGDYIDQTHEFQSLAEKFRELNRQK